MLNCYRLFIQLNFKVRLVCRSFEKFDYNLEQKASPIYPVLKLSIPHYFSELFKPFVSFFYIQLFPIICPLLRCYNQPMVCTIQQQKTT